MKCPGCGYENPAEALACGLCSELLSSAPRAVPSEVRPQPEISRRRFPYEITIFFAGLLLYPVIHALFFLDLMCSYLTILIHELGHSLMFLAFGQVALPKLDFVYGGGIAVPILTSGKVGPVLITGLLVFLIYLNRKNKVLLVGAIVLAAGYPFLAFTWGQDILIIAAGHLCKAVGAGICFYRCLAAVNVRSFERPIYAVLGWWITIHGMTFCWQLGTNISAREDYLYDPVRYHDFARIMDDTGWGFGQITAVFAIGYLILVLLSLVLVSWKLVRKPDKAAA